MPIPVERTPVRDPRWGFERRPPVVKPIVTATRALALAGVVLAVATLCACDRARAGRGGGVLLVAIDGFRADHVSSLGYDRPTTPNLDALAEQGTQFTQMFSTAPALIPAHVSLLTGCDPVVARLRIPRSIDLPEKYRWSIPHRAPRLAMRFLVAAAGEGADEESFATAAFLDTADLPPFGRYDAGFGVFEYDDLRDRRNPSERGAGALTALFLKWLGNLDEDRSWFAYLHLRDLERVWVRRDEKWDRYFSPRSGWDHVPAVGASEDAFFAVPRSRWGGAGVTLGDYEARYDGAIRRVDETLGRMFQQLELMGRWENTTISVVGTHGVQFGEAGRILNSDMLSVADLHVPWIVRAAPSLGLPTGIVTDDLASLIDVAPTLLDLSAQGVAEGMHGRSQIAAIGGQSAPVREFAFASRYGRVTGAVTFGRKWTLERTLFDPDDRDLLIQWFGSPHPDGGLERRVVYDRSVTPFPPLFGEGEEPPADVARALDLAVRNWQEAVLGSWAVLQDSPMLRDKGTEQLVIDRLRELGYL